jgi:hypothetical protein
VVALTPDAGTHVGIDHQLTSRHRAIVRYLQAIGDLIETHAYVFPGSTWAVLSRMATYATSSGGGIRPSSLTLAARTGYSRRAVGYAIRDLRAAGLIVETARLNTRASVCYRLGPAITDAPISGVRVQYLQQNTYKRGKR